MDNKLFLIGLVIFNVVQFIVACDRTASICEKYCQIEQYKCGGLKHPLCTKFNLTDLNPFFKAQIKNLTSSDVRNTILFEINRFRNDLALGYVMNHSPAANLHVVKWSFDLQEILEAQLQYTNVCTRISTNDTEFTEFSKFVAHRQGHFYHLTEMITIIKSSYDKIKWNPLIRAEFNQIGCIMTEENSDFTLNCLTNTAYSENMTFDPRTGYEIGNPCNSCECSVIWSGLCDNDSSNIFSNHHYGNKGDEHFILLWIMLGVVVLLIVIVIGLACLCWLCIECVSKPDEAGTYTLRHKFNSNQPRGTVFE